MLTVAVVIAMCTSCDQITRSDPTGSAQPQQHASESGALASDPPQSEPEANSAAKRKIRCISITEKITLGDFAAKYNTTPEKINAINGLALSRVTMLAKGSELYVPDEP